MFPTLVQLTQENKEKYVGKQIIIRTNDYKTYNIDTVTGICKSDVKIKDTSKIYNGTIELIRRRYVFVID